MKIFFEKMKQIGLACAIAILFPLTVHYAIQVIKPQPEFEFSKQKEKQENLDKSAQLEVDRKKLRGDTVPVEIKTQEGTFSWQANFIGENHTRYNELTEQILTLTDIDEAFNKQQEEEHKEWKKSTLYQYDRLYFFIALILGLVTLLLGLIHKAGSVGFGLIFGGLFTILSGYIHFWTDMSNVIKFLSLLIPVSIIICIGTVTYKKLNKD